MKIYYCSVRNANYTLALMVSTVETYGVEGRGKEEQFRRKNFRSAKTHTKLKYKNTPTEITTNIFIKARYEHRKI
jgi:hypothetical protein